MKPPNNATRPPLLLLFLPPLSLSFVWHSHAHFICLNQGHTHCKWSIHTTWWALPTIWLLNGQEHKWHEAHYCNFVCPARVVPFAISLYWCLRWSATGSSCDKSMFEIKSATSTHRYMLWFRCMQQLWQTYFFCTSNSLLHKALFCSPLSPFFFFLDFSPLHLSVALGLVREECTIKVVAALAHHLLAFVCVGCC